jgi:hypothetical protein
LVKILIIAAALALGLFGLAYACFYWTVNALIVQPLEQAGDWIGKIEVKDHGGDISITLPPTEDGLQPMADGAQQDPG